MKNLKYIFIILLFTSLPCRPDSFIESRLRKDIEDNRLDIFSKPKAAFILSGATHRDSLQYYMDWYNQLLQTLKDYNFDPFDRTGSASKVFGYLHSNWLITYKEKATTLLNIVKQKQFNCVAGTILYNLICEDMGWTTEAFETPTHTYTIFTDFEKRLMVENTSSMGFNIMQNLKEYSRYLLQFYPENQAYQIGLEQIYAHENTNGRQIDNTELLGLLAYNRAYFAMEIKDYKTAYDFVTLAQKFNRDSRSNYNFEIDLYQKWGKKLFDEKNYTRAFEVFADAYYRYWDINIFKQNAKAAFYNALSVNWVNKQWPSTSQMIVAMLDLDILEDNEINRLVQILGSWAEYFYRSQHKKECLEVAALWASVAPDDPQLRNFQKAINSLN